MSTPPSSDAPESLHQAFSWLPSTHKNDEVAQFYALTKDVCLGLQTCVELAHFSTMDRDSDTAPVLNIADTDRLLRLMAMPSQLLGQHAAMQIDTVKSRGNERTE